MSDLLPRGLGSIFRWKVPPDGLKGDPGVLVEVDARDNPAFQRPRFPRVPDGQHLLLRGLQPRALHETPEGVVVVPGRERVFVDDARQQLRLERRFHGSSPALDQDGSSKGETTGLHLEGPPSSPRSGPLSDQRVSTGLSGTSGSRPDSGPVGPA